jgi:two-component system, OmpR family, response regulator CssR
LSYLIHLVEDEPNLNQVLASYLTKEGWEVRSFTDGETARGCIGSPPHLWILDIMLPGVDGFQLIREIKAVNPATPVIFISARDADLDRVIGLELGSDDYLAKPFLPRELVIRTRNLLGRIYKTAAAAEPTSILIPPYRLEPGNRTVKHADTALDLTSKEFDMLHLFFTHSGQAFTREQLLSRIWGDDYFGSDRVVDDLIRRVRKKMPELRLETLYGHGYRLVKS